MVKCISDLVQNVFDFRHTSAFDRLFSIYKLVYVVVAVVNCLTALKRNVFFFRLVFGVL